MVGADGIAALFSAVERVACQKNVPAHIELAGPVTPGPSRFQAHQDNAGENDHTSLATRVSSNGFVDEVIPRRRGNEKKVVLTRELLESYHHESLNAVTEHLGLSKTTIKAACRRLGLPKWPYHHTGPRKRQLGVPKPEQHAAESAHERSPKNTFHELMDKRQRIGAVQMPPLVTPGLLPGTTLMDLQAMHLQSLSAISAMATTLNATGQHHAFNAPSPAFQGPSFLGGALLGGNFGGVSNIGGNYVGNYGGSYMNETFGGFKPWGGFTQH